MAVTFVSQYPGGYVNLPSTTTPIMAASCDGWDAGIIDAQAQATAAQATADAALAAAGGDAAFFVPGLSLTGADPTKVDDGPAIQAALDDIEKGLRPSRLLVHSADPTKKCYINSVVQCSTSNTIVGADVPFVFGPLGKIQVFGDVEEVPVLFSAKPALTANAATGATVLHLDFMIPELVVGAYIGLRGHRDATGKPTQIFFSYLTAVNTGALTITLATPLDETYLALNSTTWSNKESQVTVVTQSAMTGTPTRGDIVVNVVTSAPFQVGDIVQLTDDTHTLDDGTPLVEQTGNFSHKEQAHVIAKPSGTQIQLSHTLFHSYDTSKDARVVVLRSVDFSHFENWVVEFQTTPTAASNAFEMRYSYQSSFRNCHLIGTGTGGASWLTQGFRLTDSLACYVDRWSASAPDDVGPGHGYGATFYGSTLCWISNGYASGCRHSVLAFNGAAGNVAYSNISVDARISDYDWHGADCVDNLFTGNTATGGNQHTADSSVRTAFKIGNPSHVRPGDGNNRVANNLVTQYLGVAFEIIPEAQGNAFTGNLVRGADVGIKAGPLADATDLEVGALFAGNDFYDVATPLQIDGGTNHAVTHLVIDDNRWTRCGPFAVANAPKARLTRNRIIDPAVGTSYILTATGCAGIQVKGNDFSDAYRGLKLTSCPNARIAGNTLHDLTNTVVFDDGGGNTGMLFRGNDIYGFIPTTTNSAGTPSAGFVDVAGAYSPDAPAAHGLAEWNFAPGETTSGTGVALTDGVLHLMRVTPRSGRSFSAVNLVVGTLGSSTNFWVAVFDSAGNRLALSADLASAITSTGAKTLPLGSTVAPVVGRDLYVGVLSVGGTPPGIVRGAVSVVVPNIGLGSSGLRFCVNGSGLSAVPSSITPGSATGTGASAWWVGLS